MARHLIIIAAGLLLFTAVVTIRPPGSTTGALHWDSTPWRRLQEDDAVPDDWSAGFGQRLPTVQRRSGSSPSSTTLPVIEASTKLMSVTRQLRPKEGTTTAGTSSTTTTTTARSIVRTRLIPAENKTVTPLIIIENSTAPSVVELDVMESATVQSIHHQHNHHHQSLVSSRTDDVTPSLVNHNNTTTASPPEVKPQWRIRMEQAARRQPSVTNETVAVSNYSAEAVSIRPIQLNRVTTSTSTIRTTSTTTPTTTTTSTTTTTPSVLENDVKESTTTSTTSTTTTTTSTTKKGPVMHSLEDILQRLVPAREDGSNPFLSGSNQATPQVEERSYPPSEEASNEIMSDSSTTRPVSSILNQISNGTTNNSSSTSSGIPAEAAQTSTTTIYIVGVVAVVPLAGVILWAVRVQLHKRRERLSESETSSESGFRKTRLPPVALSPSKHARLFYGANDKEDLVPSSATPSGRSSPWEFHRSRLRLQTLIGEGNFGQVWKSEAEDICGCQGTLLVAVKTVKDGASNKEKQELLREMRIMQQLGPHPNVVSLLGCCTDQEPFLLIMEYVMYGRLLTFLRDHRTAQTYYNYSTDSEALTSRDLTTFAYCVAKGMEFIYSHGVVHRDLAARNVLVDHNKLCKVADFGLSRSVRDTAGEMYEQRVKGALPIRWMAPESLSQSIFTQKSDVWSFGVLVWEIVTLGSTPYPGMEAREVMRRVKDGHRLERPNHCRPEFYRLMSRCWHSDPQRRPDFGELKSELGRLLDDADGYIDLDNFQDSIYVPLESPSDESEKV